MISVWQIGIEWIKERGEHVTSALGAWLQDVGGLRYLCLSFIPHSIGRLSPHGFNARGWAGNAKGQPRRLSRKDTPRRLVARCQGRRVSKDVCIRTSPFVFSRTETLSDFQRKSSLEWQPQAPDGSGLRNKGKEGRVDGEGRHSFEGFGYEGKRERRKLMRKARSKDGGRFINFGKQVEERRGSQRE